MGEAPSQAHDLINVFVARRNLGFADLLGEAESEAVRDVTVRMADRVQLGLQEALEGDQVSLRDLIQERIEREWIRTVPSANFSAGSFVSPVSSCNCSREPLRRNGIG